jgi:GNAT superfamily N-acetyltransferase
MARSTRQPAVMLRCLSTREAAHATDLEPTPQPCAVTEGHRSGRDEGSGRVARGMVGRSPGTRSGRIGQAPCRRLLLRQSATWIPLTTVAVDAADTIVGVVIVERDELVQLAVNGGVRRLGVGAALLQAAEDEIGAEHEHACWIALHITMLLGNRNPMLNLCWRYLARPPGSAVVVAETSDPTSSVPRLTDDAAQRWDAVERKPAAKS